MTDDEIIDSFQAGRQRARERGIPLMFLGGGIFIVGRVFAMDPLDWVAFIVVLAGGLTLITNLVCPACKGLAPRTEDGMVVLEPEVCAKCGAKLQ